MVYRVSGVVYEGFTEFQGLSMKGLQGFKPGFQGLSIKGIKGFRSCSYRAKRVSGVAY